MEGRKFPLCPKGCLFGGQNRLCGPDCRGGVQSADRPNAQANRRRLEFFVDFGRSRRGESVVSAAGAVSALTASSLDLSSDAAEIVRHMQKLRTIVTALVITALAAFPAAGASAAMVMPMTTPMTTPGTTSVAATASSASGPSATASQDGMSGDCMRHADEMQSHDRTPSRDIVPGQDSAAPVKADEKGPCSHRGACGNKCLCLGLAISAVLPAGPGTAAAPLASVAPVRLASPVRSLSGIPPSPPPRV